jgi:hypothetical protein
MKAFTLIGLTFSKIRAFTVFGLSLSKKVAVSMFGLALGKKLAYGSHPNRYISMFGISPFNIRFFWISLPMFTALFVSFFIGKKEEK